LVKNKRPRDVRAKDWDAVDSPPLSNDILAPMRPARETFPELAQASAKRKRGDRSYQTRMAAVLKKYAKQS